MLLDLDLLLGIGLFAVSSFLILGLRDWRLGDRFLSGPAVMGIVNVTPDSFSDGGQHLDPHRAARHAESLVEAGAAILDIGGASSRPGADPVPVEDELRRILPVLERLAPVISVPLSIDTANPEVARRALAAGASIVNDITAGTGDAGMLPLAAETGASIVLMHMKGAPKTMQRAPTYANVVEEVYDYLASRVEAAETAGIASDRIAIDPGIGFGKTLEHNLELLRRLERFQALRRPILIGTSRKRFLGALTGRPVSDRVAGTIASGLWAVGAGADILRVHDVAAMSDALTIWQAIRKVEKTNKH